MTLKIVTKVKEVEVSVGGAKYDAMHRHHVVPHCLRHQSTYASGISAEMLGSAD